MNRLVQQGRGFSLVEILVVIAVIGVLASVTIPLVTGVPDAAKKEKLEQDVVVVNNAIDSYLAAGGDTEQLSAGNVLAALKSRVYGGMPAEMMGPQGPFLDLSVTTNATDFAWSALFTTDPRPRFYVAQNTSGVVFGKGPATAIGGVAERPDEARPSWLWSYADATPPPEREAFTPLAVDYGSSSTNVPLVGITLGPPLGHAFEHDDQPVGISAARHHDKHEPGRKLAHLLQGRRGQLHSPRRFAVQRRPGRFFGCGVRQS